MTEVSEDNKQPKAIELLTAIYESENMAYYELPAVQAMIRFFYKKLVDHEQRFLNTIIQTLDLI